ncbi:MAG: hypothetical protein COA57_12315, partial [Flavobacteriales bacterium]
MKVTYLLGAGASAEGVPVVEEFIDKLKQFENFLLHDRAFTEHKREIKVIIDDIHWLIIGIETRASVDSFAKFLYNTDQNELLRLKRLLSFFLTAHQFQHSLDRRYDLFFSKIITGNQHNIDLNPKIKLLTWNYDIQIEKGFYSQTGNASLFSCQNKLNVYPPNRNEEQPNQFSVFKLNGTAGLVVTDDIVYDQIFDDLEMDESQFFQQLFKVYESPNNKPMFYFAWEDSHHTDNVITKAINSIKDTQILVVIGYSFPDVNRPIDRKITSAMTNLKMIYLQDINNERVQ